MVGNLKNKNHDLLSSVIMGCGCGKKNGAPLQMMGGDKPPLYLDEWGPILWKYLHCLAEKMGTSGNSIVDTDQANYMETLLTMLPQVIPCTECQGHAAGYVAQHPVPSLKGQYGEQLRNTVRGWLFMFHNAVRERKQQPILVNTIEECSAAYQNCSLAKCDYSNFIQSVAGAVRQGWVRIEHWRKWYSNSERLRIISGNVVI
jgi:hypothetical protein